MHPVLLILTAKLVVLLLVALFFVSDVPALPAVGPVVRRVVSFFSGVAALVIVVVTLTGCSAAQRPGCATAQRAADTVCEASQAAARAYCAHVGTSGGAQ